MSSTSFQGVFKQKSNRVGAIEALADMVMCVPCHASVLVRQMCARLPTARSFALLVWTTCAVATFPSSALSLEACEVVEVPLETNVVPALFDARVLVEAPSSSRALTPSPGSIATVSSCWAGERMRIQEAWQIAGAPRPVLVAVLDTGIETDRAGLAERVTESVNLITESDGGDHYGHGTLVAATIAAIAPNSMLLNVKVADDRGFCTSERVAKGIRIAIRRGASVINLSLDVEPSPELKLATEDAWKRGIVLVAACGTPDLSRTALVSANDVPIRYPAGYPEVIAVASVSREGVLSPSTARAPWVDVAAPGEKTSVVLSDGIECRVSGTSFAAAHVSGLAALLCGIATDTNGNGSINDDVRLALEWSARPMDADESTTGIVDAREAVRFVSP